MAGERAGKSSEQNEGRNKVFEERVFCLTAVP